MAKFSQWQDPFKCVVKITYHKGNYNAIYNIFNNYSNREKILRAIEHVFANRLAVTHAARQSGGWAKLKKWYKDQKIDQGLSPLIWKRTGAIYDAMTALGDNANKKLKFTHSSTHSNMDIVAGPEISYWKDVHFGVPERNVPERPWLQIEKNMQPMFQQAVDKVVSSFFGTMKRQMKRNPAKVIIFR